jgi:hypothetical protein
VIDSIFIVASSLKEVKRLYVDLLEQPVLWEGTLRAPELFALAEDSPALVLGPANAAGGRLVFIERPGVKPAVEDQRMDDLGLFDLDFYVVDPDRSYRQLCGAGYRFWSAPQHYVMAATGAEVSEVCMEGPDGVRIVFLNAGQRRNRGVLLTEPARMYSECVTSAQTVDDAGACIEFWKGRGASVFVDFWMEAEEALAKALRLAPGTRFRFTLLTSEGDRNARVELLQFAMPGRDLRAAQINTAGLLGYGLRLPAIPAAGVGVDEGWLLGARRAMRTAGPNGELLLLYS